MPQPKQLSYRFQKLAPVSLSARVRNILEEAIIHPDSSVMDRLPKETELSERLGVSRTVVREAIQSLKTEGLIESKVGSGNYIIEYTADGIKRAFARFGKLHMDPEGLANYADLRLAVEVEAVVRLAERGDAATVNALRNIVTAMMRDDCTEQQYRELDLSFHLELATASGNPFFCMILQPIQEHGLRMLKTRQKSKEQIMRDHQMNSEEHMAIVNAIEARDVEAAVRTMRLHLNRPVEALRKRARENSEPAAQPSTGPS